MKYTLIFTILTSCLILNAGCGKKEDQSLEPPTMTPSEPNAISIPEATEAAQAKIQETAQNVIQDVQETAEETVAEYTVKAEEILSEITEPVADVKEKIAAYSQPELLARAQQYKQTISEKTEQLSGLTEQLKGLSMTDLLGESGKNLKNQVTQYTEQLGALKDRYSIYIDKLKELGVDLSAFGL